MEMREILTIVAFVTSLVQARNLEPTTIGATTTTEGDPRPLETIDPETFNRFFIEVSRDELHLAFAKMIKSVEEQSSRKFFAEPCITDARLGFETLLAAIEGPLEDCYRVEEGSSSQQDIVDVLDCQAGIVGSALGNVSAIVGKSRDCVSSSWL